MAILQALSLLVSWLQSSTTCRHSTAAAAPPAAAPPVAAAAAAAATDAIAVAPAVRLDALRLGFVRSPGSHFALPCHWVPAVPVTIFAIQLSLSITPSACCAARLKITPASCNHADLRYVITSAAGLSASAHEKHTASHAHVKPCPSKQPQDIPRPRLAIISRHKC